MNRRTAAVGSAIFFALAPGMVAGLIPWWLTHWQLPAVYWLPLQVLGGALVAAGALMLAKTFVNLVLDGIGTPAPLAPTRHLVVAGPYRYARNPMYLAVLAAIIGQGIALGQPTMLVYAAIVALAVEAFVHLSEEPTLHQTFGAQYDAYKHAVPRWPARRRPWTPNTAPAAHRSRPTAHVSSRLVLEFRA
jgi:protein-S-isoprenylcysteine O-methyltransferase Ste14